MEKAEQALSDAQASRANVLRAELRQAAMHCIQNGRYINDILTQQPTSIRVMDENLVRKAIQEEADKLSFRRVKVNVSTQNTLRSHIQHLQQELTEARGQILELQNTTISLQTTLLAEKEQYKKTLQANLTSAEIEERLSDLESFDLNMDRELFPTPKKKDGGMPMPRGGIIGGGNLFGPQQELKQDKLKY